MVETRCSGRLHDHKICSTAVRKFQYLLWCTYAANPSGQPKMFPSSTLPIFFPRKKNSDRYLLNEKVFQATRRRAPKDFRIWFTSELAIFFGQLPLFTAHISDTVRGTEANALTLANWDCLTQRPSGIHVIFFIYDQYEICARASLVERTLLW